MTIFPLSSRTAARALRPPAGLGTWWARRRPDVVRWLLTGLVVVAAFGAVTASLAWAGEAEDGRAPVDAIDILRWCWARVTG